MGKGIQWKVRYCILSSPLLPGGTTKVKILGVEIKKSHSFLPFIVEIHLRKDMFCVIYVNISCSWEREVPLMKKAHCWQLLTQRPTGMNYCTDAFLLHCLEMFVIVNELLMFSLLLVSRQSLPCRRRLGLLRSPTIMCVSSIAWWATLSCLGSSAHVVELAFKRFHSHWLFCSWKAISSEGKLGGCGNPEKASHCYYLS